MTMAIIPTKGNDVIEGSPDSNDTLKGLGGNDELYGYDGNDWLDGGVGIDTLVGGDGDDIYIVDNILDIVTESSDGGIDEVCSAVTFTLSDNDNLENLTLTGSSKINGIGNSLNNVLTGNKGNNSLNGSDGDDTLVGGAGADTLIGGAGDDYLSGGADSDTYFFSKSDGNDTIAGDGGNASDVLYFNDSSLSEATFSQDGNDLVISLADGGSVTVENWQDSKNNRIGKFKFLDGVYVPFLGTENADSLSGSAAVDLMLGYDGNDVLKGQAGNDLLYGDEGNDTLDGGAGIDTLVGGDGDDIYVVDNSLDIVTESSDADIDEVRSSITYTLGDNLENLTLIGSGKINGTGNSLDNVLTGNSGANSLNGAAGDDTLSGGAGADTLIGGAGDDILSGGAGSDFYIFSKSDGYDTIAGDGGNASDVLYFNDSNLSEAVFSQDGNDLVISLTGAGSVTVEKWIDNKNNRIGKFKFLDGVYVPFLGTENADSLSGSAAVDLMLGYDGNDVLKGQAGNDLLYGNEGNDTLDGGAGADVLYGGADADMLIGGAGIDTLVGGDGDDIYVVDNSFDVVTESSDADIDEVRSSITYTLGDNLENLTLTGSGKINGTGNSLDNVLTGNSGANILNGATGDDTLSGGAGSDTYYFDSNFGNDIIAKDATNNKDVIYLNAEMDMPIVSQSDNDLIMQFDSGNSLTFSGWYDGTQYQVTTIATSNPDMPSSFKFAVGNDAQDDKLTGARVIWGLGGNDTLTGTVDGGQLIGGTGNDILIGYSNGQDYYNFYLGDGNDTITANAKNVNDVIVFNSGISNDDLIFTFDIENDACIITYSNSNDSVTILGASMALPKYKFTGSDTTYSIPDTETTTVATGYYGDNTKNTLKGSNGNDAIYGYGGSDSLNGGAGNDSLYGGTGDDTLLGGTGSDTYYFSTDMGNDVISKDAGNSNDVVYLALDVDMPVVSQNGSNLSLKFDSGNSLTFAGWYDGAAYQVTTIGMSENDVVSTFKFAAGKEATGDNLTDAEVIWGLGGNDTIAGTVDDGELVGGTGNDLLIGYAAGRDNYHFYLGDGNDTITGSASNVNDVIVFHSGIDKDDLTFSTDSATGAYIITVGNDSITMLDGTAALPNLYFSESDTDYYYNTSTNQWTLGNSSEDAEQVFYGNDANNTLTGSVGDDTILGYAGDDNLYGNVGNDQLDGGTGNDTLCGGDGYDTYYFSGNFGNDVITADMGNSLDVLYFDSNIDIPVVNTSGQDVILTFDNSSSLTFSGYYNDAHYQVISLYSNDSGTVVPFRIGTNLSDTLNGGGQTIFGLGGDDTIIGHAGDETVAGSYKTDDIIGGTGDDLLTGSTAGTDYYHFYAGDGNDTITASTSNTNDVIVFHSGINKDDLTFSANSTTGAYIITVGNDSITILGGTSALPSLYFNDSDVFYYYDISTSQWTVGNSSEDTTQVFYGNDANNTLTGSVGDDTIFGYAGNDKLNGGTGNDWLSGGLGNDTYQFDTGAFGNDTIQTGNDTNVNSQDVIVVDNINNWSTTANDVILKVWDKTTLTTQSITLQNWRKTEDNQINTVTVTNSSNYDMRTRGSITYTHLYVGNDSGDNQDFSSITDNLIYLSGGNGSDSVQGGQGVDLLYGGKGKDTLRGGNDDDFVNGGGNDDLLYGEAGNDELNGGDGNDSLYGGDGKDALNGGNGNDLLTGGAGNDVYFTGNGSSYNMVFGNDTIVSANNNSDDTLKLRNWDAPSDAEKSGNDLVIYYASNDQLYSSVTLQDWYLGDGYQLSNYQNKYDDVVQNFTLAAGNDSNNTANYSSSSNSILYFGLDGQDTITGGTNGDWLYGGTGDDSLNGGAGNDLLDGGVGNDTLTGGAGNDTYVFTGGNDVIVKDTGNSQDILYITGVEDGNPFGKQSGNDFILTIGNESLTFQGWLDGEQYQVNSFVFEEESGDLVKGSMMVGSAAGEVLTAPDSTKTQLVFGLGGNDTIYGGNGSDYNLIGGQGNDLLFSGTVTEWCGFNFALGDGNDTISVSSASTGETGIVFGSGIEYDDLTFTADAAHGTYVISINANDSITIIGANDAMPKLEIDGVDGSYVFDQDTNTWYLAGATGTVYGDGNDNYIDGSWNGNTDMDNTLDGLGGNDTLWGGLGNDTLNGGIGNDLLIGGAGADFYEFGSGATGNDTIAAGNDNSEDMISIDNLDGWKVNGNDLILRVWNKSSLTDQDITLQGWNSSDTGYRITNIVVTNSSQYDMLTRGAVQYSSLLLGTSNGDVTDLSSHTENLIYLSGGGNDSIIGGQGSDILYGSGSGRDTLAGGAGNDLLYGQGNDDVLYGQAGNDELNGGDGKDSLYGGDGKDALNGGAGNDLLTGGLGNDVYFTGSGSTYNKVFGNDTIASANNNSSDTLKLRNWDAPSDAEKSGNDLVIYYASNDQLYSSVTLQDWYLGDGYQLSNYQNKYDDVVQNFTLVAGNDSNNTANYNSSSNSILYFGLAGQDTITGGTNGDWLYGGTGDDSLSGGAGNDQLYGGAGNDTLCGGAGSDTYYFTGNFGNDVITKDTANSLDVLSFVDVIDDMVVVKQSSNDLIMQFSNGSSLTFESWYDGTENQIVSLYSDDSDSGLVETIAIGSDAVNDTLTNASGLFGLGGNDTLIGNKEYESFVGGTGNDILTGNAAGIDYYDFYLGDGNDTITYTENSANDEICFYGTLTYSDLSTSWSGTNCIISYGTGGDSITIIGAGTAAPSLAFSSTDEKYTFNTTTNVWSKV